MVSCLVALCGLIVFSFVSVVFAGFTINIVGVVVVFGYLCCLGLLWVGVDCVLVGLIVV